MTALTDSALHIGLAPVAGTTYHPGYAPFILTFHNMGQEPLRILHWFEPLAVFFWFDLVRADGTPLLIAGGGKTDLVVSDMRYITLEPGEHFELTVDIHPLLPLPFEPGLYTVRVTYHNQYGENCFRGQVVSNPVDVMIEGAAA